MIKQPVNEIDLDEQNYGLKQYASESTIYSAGSKKSRYNKKQRFIFMLSPCKQREMRRRSISKSPQALKGLSILEK